jgi:hypothetical protein
MLVAEDRARWREIGETYVQRWTVVADDDKSLSDNPILTKRNKGEVQEVR